MNDPKWLGILRHILNLVGGLLIAFGIITPEDAEQGVNVVVVAIGGVLALIAFIASIKAREKNITNAQFKAMRK